MVSLGDMALIEGRVVQIRKDGMLLVRTPDGDMWFRPRSVAVIAQADDLAAAPTESPVDAPSTDTGDAGDGDAEDDEIIDPDPMLDPDDDWTPDAAKALAAADAHKMVRPGANKGGRGRRSQEAP